MVDTSGIGTALLIGVAAVIILIGWTGYEIIDWIFIADTIESDKLIIPEIKLTTDGKNIDTIYIYKK